MLRETEPSVYYFVRFWRSLSGEILPHIMLVGSHCILIEVTLQDHVNIKDLQLVSKFFSLCMLPLASHQRYEKAQCINVLLSNDI